MALSGGQKFALWMVVLGAGALCAGSAAPYWVKLEVASSSLSWGLWYKCTESQCLLYKWGDLTFSDFTVWFYVAHAAGGVSTLIALGVAFVSLGKLCGNGKGVTGTGAMALVAGLLGVATGVVYYLKSEDVIRYLGQNDWAFYTFSAGAGVLAIFSIVLLALPSPSSTAVGPY